MIKGKGAIGIYSISLACALIVWQVASVLLHSPLLLPSATQVFSRLAALCVTQGFWQSIGATFVRSITAFAFVAALSLILGICTGISSRARAFFALPLAVIKSTPVVSFILLALFWFSSSTVPIFVSILMTLPPLTAAVSAGIQNIDIKLYTMTDMYAFSAWQKIRYLYIPSVLPYFLSGAASALGMSWKVVVAGEVLSLPRHSVGNALQAAKVHLETADVFAWTIAVIIISFLSETLFNAFTKRTHAHKERRT